MNTNSPNTFFSLARIALGLIFLWAFFDKLLGLGRATKAAQAWIEGGSPTSGFLKNAVDGPMANIYHNLAGNPVVDWLFMIGLLGLGIALVLGIATKIAGYAGSLMMILMWSAVLPPANNPIFDEHIIYALLLLGLATSNVGDAFGLANKWSSSALVQRFPFLK